MVQRSAVPLADIFATCERFYERDGFVKWSDVGKVHGLSRQAIQLRLKLAMNKGELDLATFERWQSMSSRRTATAKQAQTAKEEYRERERRTIRTLLTQENCDWLRAECVFRKLSTADIINGLITRERERLQSSDS